MKVSSTIVWASTAYTVWAAANEAYVCTSDKTHPSLDSPRIISPGTARLAFAQRLGLSQYHEIGDAEDQVFEVLSELPGVRPQLFTDEEPEPFPRVLTIINDVQDPQDLIRSIDHQLIFKISNPPTWFENQKLLQDLMEQDGHRRGQDTCRSTGVFATAPTNDHDTLINAARNSDRSCGVETAYTGGDFTSLIDTLLSTSKSDWTITYHANDLSHAEFGQYDPALENLKTSLSYIAAIPSIESTIVILPMSHSRNKRTSSSWGGANPLPRRLPTEEPLTPQASAAASPSPPENLASASPNLGPASFPSSGPLPSCFSTLKSLTEATRNCSGHGTPTNRSIDPGSKQICWSCVCDPTVITDGEGRNKTFRWAGAACSKKDVSESFWLLAVVTIGLLGAAGWGVGLLASMGSEELPGVLSAGVGGPRAQK